MAMIVVGMLFGLAMHACACPVSLGRYVVGLRLRWILSPHIAVDVYVV